MRKSTRLVAVVATTMAAAGVNAAVVLDQVNDVSSGSGYSASPAVISTVSLAQTFTAGITGTLSKVGLMLNRGAGATSGSFTLSILNVTGGMPDDSGSSLLSQAFGVAGLPLDAFNYSFTDFDVSAANVVVTAGQQYAIAVTYAGVDFPDWLLWDSRVGSYSGGELFFNQGGLATAWETTPDGFDGGFRTFVDAISVPEPVTIALFGLGLAGLGAVRRKSLSA